MNGKVNNFLEKLKRSSPRTNNNGRQASVDSDHIQYPSSNGPVERELKQVVKPIDLDFTSDSNDIGDGLDDPICSRKGCMLAYTLDQLLNDSSALSFFINYLDSVDKTNLIKFWMHTEGLRASARSATIETGKAAQSLCYLDAKNIFSKYIDEQSSCTIALPKKIYNRVKERMDPESFDPRCFDDAQMFVKQLFELRYFQEFMGSVYYKKHELEVLSKQTCSVLDILHIEQLLMAFMEMTEEHAHRNLVEMVMAVDTWERQYEDVGDAETLEDAMAVYDRFFSLQASRGRVVVSDVARVALEGRICTEDGRPQYRSFAPAKQWALDFLTKTYLSSFINSAPFQSYVSDLVYTIESTVELPRSSDRPRRTGSIASSSGVDSLPSIFNRHFENLDRHPPSMGGSEEATPTGTPRTPRTPKSARLAEVDNMGRYTPLYDTTFTADANQPSKFKTRLRKYWDKSTLREEEIAEEVARTIIADIQTMVESAGRG